MDERGRVGALLEKRALAILATPKLLYAFVVVGIILRVAQYVADRSLWADESSLALNLINRPLSGLAKPLDLNQAAPIGFLLVEGIVGRVAGFSEYALRFFPIVCGVLSVPIFGWLARRLLAEAAALATLLFSVASGLIYYSSEVKPYGVDVAVSVALLAAGVLIADAPSGRSRKPLLVAAAGVLLIPLSYPSIFIVVSVAGVLAVRLLVARDFSVRSPQTLAVSLWGLTAVAIGVFGATRASGVRESFSGSGAFSGISGSSPAHVLNAMGTRIVTGLGVPLQGHTLGRILVALTAASAVAGAVTLALRKPVQLWMLLLPFPLLLVAAAAHLYPILERTELFLLPAAILFIAEGAGQAARRSVSSWRALPAFLLAGAVVTGPVALAAGRLVHPRTVEEIKPVLQYVRDHWHAGDTLYVAAGSQDVFLYYEECGCLKGVSTLWPLRPLPGVPSQVARPATSLTPNVVLGRYHGVDTSSYVRDLQGMRTRRRIWFLYSHLPADWTTRFVRTTFLRQLALDHKLVAEVDRHGAHAYLYVSR